MVKKKLRVAGYVKLAKLWEKNRDKAIAYHYKYYKDKYSDINVAESSGVVFYELYDVYIDITGQRNIKNRPEMIRLLKDCTDGKIDVIASQTRGYLAANNEEFYCLLHYLFGLPHTIEIVTEDERWNINTVKNEDNQKEALLKMSTDYVKVFPDDYAKWIKGITAAMGKLKS